VVGAELSEDERRLVASYWWQRAAGEMTSWVGWRHVLDDLRAEGSPEPVLGLAERAVADEYRHALWCRDWAEHFGHAGGEVRPRGERRLEFRGRADAENRILRIALCCFTETVGCFTLQRVRDVVRVGDLRKLNQRHLADELVHSRAGWAHLSTLSGDSRDFLRSAVPELLELLPRACCDGPELDREDLVPFGYFTPHLLRAAHDAAVTEVIRPGLLHLGLLEAA
jgi:hypothetical protein